MANDLERKDYLIGILVKGPIPPFSTGLNVYMNVAHFREWIDCHTSEKRSRAVCDQNLKLNKKQRNNACFLTPKILAICVHSIFVQYLLEK